MSSLKIGVLIILVMSGSLMGMGSENVYRALMNGHGEHRATPPIENAGQEEQKTIQQVLFELLENQNVFSNFEAVVLTQRINAIFAGNGMELEEFQRAWESSNGDKYTMECLLKRELRAYDRERVSTIVQELLDKYDREHAIVHNKKILKNTWMLLGAATIGALVATHPAVHTMCNSITRIICSLEEPFTRFGTYIKYLFIQKNNNK